MSDLPVSSNQRAVQLVALDVLRRHPGERLPTSLQYQELLGVGSGTVQKALRLLEGTGAAEFRSHGHQGTFAVRRHFGQLWAIAELGVIRGAMPLPDSREGAGLATGLREQADLLRMPLQLRFMHGSTHRLRAILEDRVDFAILSAGAALSARTAFAEERWVEEDLGPHSYYSEGSLILIIRPGLGRSARKSIRTVGVDHDSHDHTQLTSAEFPGANGYRYQEVAYPDLLAAVAERRVDAAVWHRTTIPVPLGLLGVAWRHLERPAAVACSETLSPAVMLAPRRRPEIQVLLQQFDGDRIRATQQRVVTGEVPPVF